MNRSKIISSIWMCCALITLTTLAGCQKPVEENEKTEELTIKYQITEENEKLELIMANQPESSYWFPNELLEWNSSDDKDFKHNISTIPLQERADRKNLTAINDTQNIDTNIMAISIMNSSTSGNAPHGLNIVDAHTFSYWQYVDTLVYWGGSSGEGLIVPPSPDVTDIAHKNGVKVIGTIFFPQTGHGGKMEWLNDFLVKDDNGNFKIIPKLIEVANVYGFDGWFINQETEGTETNPLTVEHTKLIQEFIIQLKELAPELEIVYYDSMTDVGEMDWQNALTDANAMFMKTEDNKDVADTMFLNFWWTNDKLADQELLKSSADKALSIEVDPYDLYAGVDVQMNGYLTPIRWNLFEQTNNSTYTSLGLYCPSWAYYGSSDMEDYYKKENAMWVNSIGDPSAPLEDLSDTSWRGISTYITERTAITKLPFITNFSLGNGYSFFKNGEQISKLDWNNRSIADVLPTYRYIIENDGENTLAASIDVSKAYYGGNSLKLRGNMQKDKTSIIKMYSTDLVINDKLIFNTILKSNTPTNVSAVLTLNDNEEVIIKGDTPIGKEWTTINFDTSELLGKTIKNISYIFTVDEDIKNHEINFGNITMTEEIEDFNAIVSKVVIDDYLFDDDEMYAGVRLSWDSDVVADYYEVYQINNDKSKSLLGVSNTTSFYVNTLPRTEGSNNTMFEVIPVSKYLKEGTGSGVELIWPDNSLPKASMEADITLVAPNQSINLTSTSSENTTEVSWILDGSTTTSAKGETVSVVYENEGTYNITVTATNEAGTSDKTYEKAIVVTEKAKDGVVLLSQNANTTASSFVNENEGPQFAVDGDISKKWCATGSAPHDITIDLNTVKNISGINISHAEAGGESPDMNTSNYEVLVSEDGVNFTSVVTERRNYDGVTKHAFAPTNARYVKVVITKPTKGTDSAVRIYEIEVFGLEN